MANHMAMLGALDVELSAERITARTTRAIPGVPCMVWWCQVGSGCYGAGCDFRALAAVDGALTDTVRAGFAA